SYSYFDARSRSYRIYSPPEIRRWSVSAILVETDSIWMALDHRGEYGNYAGGLLCWNRQTHQFRGFKVHTVITGVVRGGDALYLTAADGILVLHGDAIESYFVDRSADGRYRMTRRNR
ncbi:MAG: hypothetical protein ABI165_21000, partial [Bryobacteraceae bacterium]